MTEYTTHPTTGVVHLCGPAPVRPKVRHRALCGVLLTPEWILGDETSSGLATTCRRCRQLFQPLSIPNASTEI